MKKYRNKVAYGLNLCLNEIIKFHESPELTQIGFHYKSSLELLQEKVVDFKATVDAFGVGARAGVLTPTLEDEKFFRNLISVAEINDKVIESWEEDGGFRTPITLKGSDEAEAEEKKEI